MLTYADACGRMQEVTVVVVLRDEWGRDIMPHTFAHFSHGGPKTRDFATPPAPSWGEEGGERGGRGGSAVKTYADVC